MKVISIATIAFFTLASAGAAAQAAPPAKHAAKPAAKPVAAKKSAAAATAPAANRPIVLGTTQLPGEFGKFGQTYTIGKYQPINFTLDSARFAPDHFTIESNTWSPKNDEKLLILRFTVHNPLPQEQPFSAGSLRFTTVDAEDVNHDAVSAVCRAGVYDKPAFTASLKPAQKVQLETAILVPANGVVPKLIVQRESGAPVIRYDLRGKVAPLAAPFADPADPAGATLRPEIPAVANEWYPFGPWDIRLEAVGALDEPIWGKAPKAGEHYVTMTVRLRNATNVEQAYYWGYMDAVLRDADGEKVAYQQSILRPTRIEAADGKLLPAEEARFRFYFPLSKEAQPKTLSLRECRVSGAKGRTLVFDLTTVPPAAQAAAVAR